MSRYSLKKSAHDEGAVKEKAPKGFFTFQITDYKEKNKDGAWLQTSKGDPKVLVICEIVNDQEHSGKSALHNVIFYRPESPSIKGIGMTRHFLKCIDEKWEGDLEANPENWVGKRFKAEVIHDGEYANLVDIQPTEQQVVDLGKPTKKDDGEIAWDDDL